MTGRRWHGIGAAVGVYLTRPVLIVALLGFSAGLPLSLTGATLALWLADRGVDLATVGLAALLGLPYTLKVLWAPLVDALAVPGLSRLLGRRRGWLMAAQFALMGAIALLALQEPAASPLAVAIAALVVATASATQDIVIDAYRVESLAPDAQAAGMASYVAAYRIAMLVSGAGVVVLVAWLEAKGIDKAGAWQTGLLVMAALVVVGMVATLWAREPKVAQGPVAAAATKPDAGSPLARVLATARRALTAFFTRPQAVAVLAFVVAYKLCDALAGTLTGPFVLAIGYDKASYAGIVKGVGLIATLAGGFLGGFIARAVPLRVALWIGGLLQPASNLVFAWLAGLPPSDTALAAAIIVENLAGGIGTVVFVAYLSALCGAPEHTATQYALLTALAAVGRTLLAGGSGFAAAALGWPAFFAATALAGVPALLLLVWLGRRRHFETVAAPGACATR